MRLDPALSNASFVLGWGAVLLGASLKGAFLSALGMGRLQ